MVVLEFISRGDPIATPPRRRHAGNARSLHWHDLRHEALSRLADDGVPVHELQMLAGHASITTTQRYMNARANSLAESIRQARERRAQRWSVATTITFRWDEMTSQGPRLGATDRHPCVTRTSIADHNPQKSVRPAGIEPAAPRLGGHAA